MESRMAPTPHNSPVASGDPGLNYGVRRLRRTGVCLVRPCWRDFLPEILSKEKKRCWCSTGWQMIGSQLAEPGKSLQNRSMSARVACQADMSVPYWHRFIDLSRPYALCTASSVQVLLIATPHNRFNRVRRPTGCMYM